MTKEQVRLQIRASKKLLAQDEIKEYSIRISRMISVFNLYKKANVIFLYMSYNQEVDTRSIIIQAMADGKIVAVPKVEDNRMVFYAIRSLDQVSKGYQGILEPISDEVVIPTADDLMLMPGLAFSNKGERIGYGGGFYDRYLEQYKEIAFTTCGLAYGFQVFDALPCEEFDQKIGYVITATNIYQCLC